MRHSGPPFRSVRGAVRWAYFTVRRPLLKNSSIYSVSLPDDDLTATEKRAQAALMVGTTERALSIEQMAFVHVIWLAAGKLTRNARARRRDMRAVIHAKTRMYGAAQEKVLNDERLTKGEHAMLDAGSPLALREQLPPYFTEDAGPEAWLCLVRAVRQLDSSMSFRGLETLIRRCRGDAVGVHAVRRGLRCNMNAVADFQERMVRTLGKLEQPIVYELEPRFYDNEWLEPV